MLHIEYFMNDHTGEAIFAEVNEDDVLDMDKLFIFANWSETAGDLEYGDRIHVTTSSLMPVVLPPGEVR